ncbi:MAG TPA: cupin-like domain-containing protein [Kofleriaceae bacterium]|jgi:lysine-specific demethylase 8
MHIVGTLERISADPAAFAAFERSEMPVVIAGALTGWPALARWSPDYLAALAGDIAIRFKRSATGAHPDFHAATLAEAFATGESSLREFLAAIAVDRTGQRLFTGDEKFMLRRRDGATTLDPELAALYADVVVPAVIPPDRLYTVWAWLSGAGVRTWMHYDNNGCHNLNAQITGAKDCVLVDPAQLDRLALWPPGGANPAVNCSQIDVHAPDLARFPEFADVRALAAHLEPGDLLFIPAWWLHAFHHTGAFNSNVNFWWRPVAPRDNSVSRRQAAIDAAGAHPHGS